LLPYLYLSLAEGLDLARAAAMHPQDTSTPPDANVAIAGNRISSNSTPVTANARLHAPSTMPRVFDP
jgi:hypothetical protein